MVRRTTSALRCSIRLLCSLEGWEVEVEGDREGRRREWEGGLRCEEGRGVQLFHTTCQEETHTYELSIT